MSSLRRQGGERGAGDPLGQANKDANNSIPLWVRIHIGVVWLVMTGLSVDRGSCKFPSPPLSKELVFRLRMFLVLKTTTELRGARMTAGEEGFGAATTQGKYPQQHRPPRRNNGGVMGDK